VTGIEVIIDDQRCYGCGYCVEFCPKRCLNQDSERVGRRGYALPIFDKAERCNACGICASMCPHWAITVNAFSESHAESKIKRRVAGPPRLAQDPPFAGCPGCQHPTVGRIVAETVDKLGINQKTTVLDAIPCSTSSAFGMDFGRKLSHDETAPHVASEIKRASPDGTVIAIQGYWGLSDFSFDVGALIGALIRGENFTVILCNMPFYGPKDGRPGPVNEPAGGRLEPVTRINTPEGQKPIVGGVPLHLAELAATFEGVAYSARGAITSMKDYQSTKRYVKTALQKQMDNSGFSFVEVLGTCCDSIYSAPVDSLRWIKEKMVLEFPLGEFKGHGR
jgi:2-oxoglutarate/2-oxoacid ferredoxin oxidoreductase subunit beta